MKHRITNIRGFFMSREKTIVSFDKSRLFDVHQILHWHYRHQAQEQKEKKKRKQPSWWSIWVNLFLCLPQVDLYRLSVFLQTRKMQWLKLTSKILTVNDEICPLFDKHLNKPTVKNKPNENGWIIYIARKCNGNGN